MKNIEELKRGSTEDEQEYLLRLSAARKTYGLTWDDVADLMNAATGQTYGESTYRKRAARAEVQQVRPVKAGSNEDVPPILPPRPKKKTFDEMDAEDQMLAIAKARVTARDERTQVNAIIRRIAREESLIEMANDISRNLENHVVLPSTYHPKVDYNKAGLLCISDWHYGIEIDNYWNKYNPDIAKERMAQLLSETIEIIELYNLKKVYVLNLGDMIAGKIHLPLRINSRFDVLTQVIEVTELLAQFLAELNRYAAVEYYDTLDNHSRIEPNLKESLDLESLCRITTWTLKNRMAGTGVTVNENTYGDDVITVNILGHNVAGVHGHRDKPEKIVLNMMTRTKQNFDLIVAAHYHHFSADESAETAILYNGSMMGTDEYAEKLRVAAKPSQNFIVMTEDNPTKAICKINLR